MNVTTPAAVLRVTAVGGPTAIIDIGGLRLITDPTFDPPGSYEPRPGVHLTKTEGPAIAVDDIGAVDAALLSHDHHKDNLDDAGREFLTRVPTVLTTLSGARRLGAHATALPNWHTIELGRPDGTSLTITGLPAQHGPDGSEHLVGEVTGFLLSGDGLPTVYVSGDNASLDVVRTIAGRVGTVDLAVLFVGGAQMPYLDGYLTLPSSWAPEAARILGAGTVVGIHLDGWGHFTDDRDSLVSAFTASGLADLLSVPHSGQTVAMPLPTRTNGARP